MADVKIVPVTPLADPRGTNLLQLAGFICDFCNTIPMANDGHIQLNLVRSPDRTKPLFLGPKCTQREVEGYTGFRPIGSGMRP